MMAPREAPAKGKALPGRKEFLMQLWPQSSETLQEVAGPVMSK